MRFLSTSGTPSYGRVAVKPAPRCRSSKQPAGRRPRSGVRPPQAFAPDAARRMVSTEVVPSPNSSATASRISTIRCTVSACAASFPTIRRSSTSVTSRALHMAERKSQRVSSPSKKIALIIRGSGFRRCCLIKPGRKSHGWSWLTSTDDWLSGSSFLSEVITRNTYSAINIVLRLFWWVAYST